jgi:hypothetical protein
VGFLDRLKETIQDTGWAIGAPAAALVDLAKVPFDHEDNSVGSAIKKVAGTYLDRQFQIIAGDNGGTEDTADDQPNLFSPTTGKALDALEWVYDNGIAQPYNTALITERRVAADIWGHEDNENPLDIGSAWKQADESTGGYGKGTSIGREYAYTGLTLWGSDRALSPQARQALDENSKMFDITSGAADFGARFFYDPTIVGGKAAKALRVSKGLATMGSRVTRSQWATRGGGLFASNSDRASKALDWVVDAKPTSPEVAAAFRLNDRYDGNAIANVLTSTRDKMAGSGASRDDIRETIELITRVGQNDVDALKPLHENASAAADALAALASKRDDAQTALQAALVKRNAAGQKLRDSQEWVDHVRSNGGYMSEAKLTEFLGSRSDDYLTSSEFVDLARERLRAIKPDVTAAAAEQARLEKLHYLAKFELAGQLAERPLVASAFGSTKGLERRVAQERLGTKGYRQQRVTDLSKKFGGGLGERAATAVFQSSPLNMAVKVAFPHIALGLKAADALRSPLAPRVLNFNDAYAPAGLNNFLKQAGVNPDARARLVGEFSQRADDFERSNTVDRAIQVALEAKVDEAARKHRISPRARAALLADIQHGMNEDTRRRFSQQTFTASEVDEGVRGDLIFNGKDPMPVLDTQTLKTAVLPDLHEIDHMVRRTHNYLTDLTAWATGDRTPDPNRVAEIARDVWDTTVNPRAAETFARGVQSVNNGFWRAEEVFERGMTLATNIWKKGMLLRPAYVAKYLTDSEMRNLAVLGARMFTLRVAPGLANAATLGVPGRLSQAFAAHRDGQEIIRLRAELERAEDVAAAARLGGAADDAAEQAVVDLTAAKDEVSARLASSQEGRKGRRKAYGDEIMGRGKDVQTALGPMASADRDPFGHSLMWATQAKTTATLAGDAEKVTLNNLLSSKWETVPNTRSDHLEQWAHSVNAQILQSKIVKQVLANDFDTAATVRWLKRTTEGRALRDQMPWTAADPHRWVQEVEGMILHYLPSDELLATAKKSGHIAKKQLERTVPAELRPPVHGEGIALTVNRGSTAGATVNKFWNDLFNWMGDVPEDRLARHPLYRASYEQELKRRAETMLANPYKDHYMLDEIHELAQKQSHKYARDQIKRYMYDVATTSDLSHAMRFMSPFVAAWEDTIKKWGRIAVENPVIPGRLYQAWNVPNNLGLVVDKDGNPVTEDNLSAGNYILIQTPSWLGNHKLKVGESQFRLPKQAINIVLQGGLQPGFGPLVAYPVGEFSKSNPTVDQYAKFVNPYGPPESVFDAVAPSTVKRITELVDAQSNRHAADTARMYEQMIAEYRMDPTRYPKPTPAVAEQRAKAMGWLKIANNFINPFPVVFDSPYKFYEDAYRAMKAEEANGAHEQGWADQKFIEEHGETFFPLVQSASRNNAGLLANAKSEDAFKKYQKQIDQYGMTGGEPNKNLIRLIVGPEGDDPKEQFNESAYAWQTETPLVTGSKSMIRDKRDFVLAAQDADAKLGWYKFRQFMNSIDAEANQMGLESYRDDEELVATRQEFIDNLKKELPAWETDYSQFDSGKFERDLGAVAEVAASPTFTSQPMRTDMRGVSDYVQLRSQFLGEMDELGISPTSDDAADFRQEFADKVKTLVAQNTQFAEFAFYPYLERDPLLKEVN